MSSVLRALRRRILTPGLSATSLETRGFHVKDQEARDLLETIGRTFLTGYGYAAEAASAAAAADRLETIPTRFRGFAYEGAAMGFTVLEALPFAERGRLTTFLQGRGADHVYMTYIGIGWAMARLPRFRWPQVSLDPLLHWLVLDGYGFHQAYFRTDRYVHQQFQDDRFHWPDDPHGYAAHAIDQGIGRALWFVAGAAPDVAATLIDKFPQPRLPDLYSGAGLAATYAGGVDESELREFWDRAGDYRPNVAQGSAFAAEARIRAGLLVPQTGVATRIFLDMTPDEAARVSVQARPGSAAPGPQSANGTPAYETWRRRVANELVSLGRC